MLVRVVKWHLTVVEQMELVVFPFFFDRTIYHIIFVFNYIYIYIYIQIIICHNKRAWKILCTWIFYDVVIFVKLACINEIEPNWFRNDWSIKKKMAEYLKTMEKKLESHVTLLVNSC